MNELFKKRFSMDEELSDFVDENSKEEKEQLLKKVDDLEHKYEERETVKIDVLRKLENLRQGIDSEQADLETVIDDLNTLETEYNDYNTGIVSKVLNMIKIKKLGNMIAGEQAVIEISENNIGKLENEYSEVVELLEKLEEIDAGEKEIERIESMVSDFIDKQILKLEEDKILSEETAIAELTEQKRFFEHIKEVRDIKSVSNKYNCFFVHKLMEIGEGERSPRTVLQSSVSWQQRFRILLSLGGDVSASSLRMNTGDQTFGHFPIGVILNKGKIIGAEASDMESQVKKGVRSGYDEDNIIEEEVDRSINKNRDKYNEFSLNRTDVSGIFLEEEKLVDGYDYGFNSAGKHKEKTPQTIQQEIYMELKEQGILDLAVYFKSVDNQLYVAEPEFDKEGDFVKYNKQEKSIDIESLMNEKGVIEKDKVAKIRETIFEDFPFNVNSPEKLAYNNLQFTNGIIDVLTNDYDPDNITPKQRIFLANNIEDNGLEQAYLGLSGKGTNFPVKEKCVDLESYIAGLEEVVTSMVAKLDHNSSLRNLSVSMYFQLKGLVGNLESRSLKQFSGKINILIEALYEKLKIYDHLGILSKEEYKQFLSSKINDKGEYVFDEKDMKYLTTDRAYSDFHLKVKNNNKLLSSFIE